MNLRGRTRLARARRGSPRKAQSSDEARVTCQVQAMGRSRASSGKMLTVLVEE